MNEQTLYNMSEGLRQNGKVYKSAKCLIQEGHEQRINVGHYDRRLNTRVLGSQTRKTRMNLHSAITLNNLKWENTTYAMRSAKSGIRQFVEVNYEDDTVEDMRLDCLSAKLRKNDPYQPSFSQAMSGDKSSE